MKFSIYFLMWLLIVISAAVALGQRSSYDPADDYADSHQGFSDFVLNHINPQNTDYGCQIQEVRKFLVDETVKNTAFWTIVVALSLILLSFFMLVIQRRERNLLELVAATFLAQYHNSLIDARSQAQTAIRRHNELVIATDRVAEKLRLSQSIDQKHAMVSTETIATVQPKLTTGIGIKSALTRNESGLREPIDTKPLRPNPASDSDLMSQLKTLQQQLAASHEREKNLKRELNKMQRHGQAEPTIKT